MDKRRDKHVMGKVIFQDYDELAAMDETSENRILSLRSIEMLLASTTPLHWATRYLGDDIDPVMIEQWASQVEHELLTEGEAGDMTILRQNPSNPYLLEQWQDSNWTLAFDYSKILSKLVTQIITSVTEHLEKNGYLVQADNGSATGGINPNCPTTLFNADLSVLREDALCMAVTAWCVQVWSVLIAQLNALIHGGVPGGGSSPLAFVQIVSNTVANVVIGILIGNLAAVTESSITHGNAFTDYQGMKELVQDAVNYLRGKTINQVNFQACFTALSYPSGSNKAVLLYALQNTASNRGSYLAFCDGLGKAYTLRNAGVNESVCVSLVDWMSAITSYQGRGSFEWLGDGIMRILSTTDAGSGKFWGSIFLPNVGFTNYKITILDADWIDTVGGLHPITCYWTNTSGDYETEADAKNSFNRRNCTSGNAFQIKSIGQQISYIKIERY